MEKHILFRFLLCTYVLSLLSHTFLRTSGKEEVLKSSCWRASLLAKADDLIVSLHEVVQHLANDLVSLYILTDFFPETIHFAMLQTMWLVLIYLLQILYLKKYAYYISSVKNP